MSKQKSDLFCCQHSSIASSDFLVEPGDVIRGEPAITSLLRLYYPIREQRAKFLTGPELALDGQTPLEVWHNGERQRVKDLLMQRLAGMIA